MSKYKVPTDLIESSSLARRAQAEKWGIWSLEGGLSGLTDALRASVEERGADVVTGQPIKSVELAGSKAIVNGEEFDHAFISVSATAAAGMLNGQDQLTSLLRTIPYVDVGVVNVSTSGYWLVLKSSTSTSTISCFLLLLRLNMRGGWSCLAVQVSGS